MVPIGDIHIVVLACVDNVEAGDPSEDGATEHERRQQVGRFVEYCFAADRDPGGNG